MFQCQKCVNVKTWVLSPSVTDKRIPGLNDSPRLFHNDIITAD